MALSLGGSIDLSLRPATLVKRDLEIKNREEFSVQYENISKFRSIIDKHFPSKSYLFNLDIPFISSDIRYLCISTTIPELSNESISIDVGGTQTVNIGSSSSYGDSWSATFLLEEGHELRNQFLKWMSKIHNISSNSCSSPKTYKSDDCYIAHLDRNRKTGCLYKIKGLFPTKISNVELKQEPDTSIQTFTVDFKYDYWEIEYSTKLNSLSPRLMGLVNFNSEFSLGQLGGVYSDKGINKGGLGGAFGTSVGQSSFGLNARQAFGL
jgi:hypothetical protein